MKNKPVIILFGPTAVGKTAFLEALKSQRKSHIEIISADARQIYRGCAISTAQPSVFFTKKTPYHLIDELHFSKEYCVADFVRCANKKIIEIHTRNNVPLVSGGTAYYMYHLWRGLPDTPASNIELRNKLISVSERHGIEYLYKQLCEVDVTYAQSIAANDKQRIIRALEIFHTTGKIVSDYKKTTQKKPQNDYNYILVGLKRDKTEIHKRIRLRIERMFKNGIEKEVYTLYQQGLGMKHNAAHTIGIQEFLQNEAVISAWDSHKQISDDVQNEVKEKIIIHTRQYAKRQMTFFRRFESVHWCNLDEQESSQGITSENAAMNYICKYLNITKT